jgi:hypothetical protein
LDPHHEEDESKREWVGGSFDLAVYDLAAVDCDLAALSPGTLAVIVTGDA